MAGKRWMPFYSDGSLWPLSLGQPQQEVLRIAGVFPDASLLDAYRQAYPQVAVAVSPELPSQEDAFAQALVNRTLEADIIITSTASELYGPLLEKGVRPAPGWGQPVRGRRGQHVSRHSGSGDPGRTAPCPTPGALHGNHVV